jgi:hypothetical protein
MNKKPKKQFVMLGERYENGKIAKNEYYSIIDFVQRIKNRICLVPKECSLWDKLTRSNTYLRHKEQNEVNDAFKLIEESIIGRMRDLIHEDTFGKKKTKKR